MQLLSYKREACCRGFLVSDEARSKGGDDINVDAKCRLAAVLKFMPFFFSDGRRCGLSTQDVQ